MHIFSSAALLGLALLLPAAASAQGGPPGPPPVTVAKPLVKQIVEMDEYTGRFEAAGAVDIRARVNGYLEKVAFVEGGLVREGELLFTIDRRPYQAVLNQALANLNVMQTRLDFAKLEFDRFERLARSGTAAERSLDEKRQAYQAAQAEIQGVRAAVESARLSLSFTDIRAPVSGRIGRKLVHEGNLVRENETLLASIVAVDPVYFYFDVDERSWLSYRRMARSGAQNGGAQNSDAAAAPLKVAIALSDETAFSHPGQIDFTDIRLDAATGTMRLRAKVANADGFLTPGLFGRVAVPGSPVQRGVLLPDEAIATDLDRRIVYVVGDDGSVRPQPVRTGSRHDGYRIIREGLKGDETVIVSGLQRVRFGGGRVTPQMKELPPVHGAPASPVTAGPAK